ncbi:MAG: hypothetical protein ACFBSC_09705 [Microcoleaceae cyanobacterium]
MDINTEKFSSKALENSRINIENSNNNDLDAICLGLEWLSYRLECNETRQEVDQLLGEIQASRVPQV